MGSVPPTDPRTDETLIQAVSGGDTHAFEVLYYRYRDWVVRLACRYADHHDDALDVLQETFAYLLRKAPHLHLSARMTTFLYPVVKHLALDARAKRGRLNPRETLPEPEAPAVRQDDPLRTELAQVMASLSDDQREIVLMRFVDDLTLAEIAEALSLPIGTVKSKLHRALQRLRDDPQTKRYFAS